MTLLGAFQRLGARVVVRVVIADRGHEELAGVLDFPKEIWPRIRERWFDVARRLEETDE